MVKMKKLNEIKKELKGLEPLLKERFKVKRIAIFGSYLRNKQKLSSDLDILVEFSEPIGLFSFVDLENFLAQKLGIKVDLVMKDALKLRIKNKIIQEAIYV